MQKLFKGSALVYTLIMMLFLMVGALALMTTTIIQQRGVSGTTESVRAFQLANDGFEDVIAKYNRGASNLSGLGTCNNGTVTNTIATGSYTATFTDSNNTAIANCATPLSDVAQVKVVSTVGSSTRAIEAAFAANSGTVTGGCVVRFSSSPNPNQYTIRRIWGDGCKPLNTTGQKTMESPGTLCNQVAEPTFECGSGGANSQYLDISIVQCLCVAV